MIAGPLFLRAFGDCLASTFGIGHAIISVHVVVQFDNCALTFFLTVAFRASSLLITIVRSEFIP